MSKCLIIFPPQWSPFSPHLAPVTIAANIRKAGHKCEVRDLNIEFYHEVLKKNFLEKIIVDSIKSLPALTNELKKVFTPEKKPEDYSLEEQIKAKKLLLLNNIRDNKLEESKKVIDNAENAINLLKDKEAFYNLQLAANSIGILDKALEIVSISEFPQEFSLYYFRNNYVKQNWENILKYCSGDTIFARFYTDKAVDIIKNKYDYIGISVSSSSQFFSALILAKMLKAKARKTKICLGGNHISRITEAVKQTPGFFKIFADYVVYEEGERATTELLEYFNGKRDINEVSSLIYPDNSGNVKINPKKELSVYQNLPRVTLKGLSLMIICFPKL